MKDGSRQEDVWGAGLDLETGEIELLKPKECKTVKKIDLASAIKKRRSQRVFLKKSLLLEELSFLLWAARKGEGYTLRTVPSAGGPACLGNLFGLRSCFLRRLRYRSL